jgi:hypothetical protein
MRSAHSAPVRVVVLKPVPAIGRGDPREGADQHLELLAVAVFGF